GRVCARAGRLDRVRGGAGRRRRGHRRVPVRRAGAVRERPARRDRRGVRRRRGAVGAAGRDPRGGMSRVFGREPLEPLATFWRVHRRDGVTLGFTSHDRDLWFDGVLHRAAPGMLPSAIRRTSGLTGDSAEVEGALTHDALSEEDLANARFDGARIAIGAVDWRTLDRAVLYRGEIGAIGEEDGKFTAELRSAKAALEADPVP